jgi:hypothetical protein
LLTRTLISLLDWACTQLTRILISLHGWTCTQRGDFYRVLCALIRVAALKYLGAPEGIVVRNREDARRRRQGETWDEN